ncbi:phosphotransacetylase family protein [Halosimplex rubrum]|uniref:Phosphotransacetylase family protein n=1 Tax=Halosimplex rubrum TaxID=869889 RepID=A0A7D5TQ53_9EURY|nr:phosphotransacetylase family protein [Halosimplex rubrum]QLH78614.1 phosphotransacetylase family protein [Halosimplex rubrum]
MKPIFVTSTGEGTGKTAIAIAVAKLAQDRGLDVAYFKPKGTRLKSPVGKTRDEDPLLARELLGIDADLSELEPVVYSPAFIEEAIRGNRDGEVRERVREHFDALDDDYDLVVVEGGGRLETGGIVGLTDPDVAELLDARALVVGGYANPADVDGVLAAARQFEGRLAGVLFNAVADANFDSLNTDVVPFLEARDIPVLGIVPRVQELAGITVADLADALDADLLNPEASTDGFVERFAVGAMGSDAALRHFRRMRNAAMVTGGDRSEIQAAALEAPGIECIVLTGGLRPSGAILGKAAEADVPVLLVQSDTRVTIDRVEEVISTGRTRDPETVERMVDLLADHADLAGLLADGESTLDTDPETGSDPDPVTDDDTDTDTDGE